MLIVICRQGGDGHDMMLGLVNTKEKFIDICHRLGLKVEEAASPINSRVLMEAEVPQRIGQVWLELEEVPNFSDDNLPEWFRGLLESS